MAFLDWWRGKPNGSRTAVAAAAAVRPKPERPQLRVVTGAKAAPGQSSQPAQSADVRSKADIPAGSVLYSHDGGEFPLNEKLRKLVAVYRMQDGKFFLLLSGRSEEHRSAALSIKSRLEDRKGYVLPAFYYADPLLFRELCDGNRHAKAASSDTQPRAMKTDAVRLFEDIVHGAVKERATDIHFCIRDHSAAVLLRVDGILGEPWKRMSVDDATDAVGAAFTSMATEGTRSEGTFNLKATQSCSIDFFPPHQTSTLYRIRYQSSPVLGGADVVLRLLKIDLGESTAASLESLGYGDSHVHWMSLAARRTVGMIVVAGVTGSGKSTTLKTLMNMGGAHRLRKKSYSVEDPVEYKMFGVSQISVQRSATEQGDEHKNPFIAPIRAILRMDPDRIMVGEIRDRETGSLCKDMVLSGHQVLTTVHAASGIEIVTRLASDSVGLPRQVLSLRNFISALVYQRLLPRNCPHCSLPAVGNIPPERLELILDRFGIPPAGIRIANPDGCPNCQGSGVNGLHGQTVLAEIILPDANMLRMFRDEMDSEAEEYWRRTRHADFDDPDMQGKTAFEHGLYKMANGEIDPAVLEDAFEAFETYHLITRT